MKHYENEGWTFLHRGGVVCFCFARRRHNQWAVGCYFGSYQPLDSSSPASQTASISTSEAVAFTVDAVGINANGHQEFAYQWFKAGNPLSNDGNHITGATTRALLISGVQATDAGSYHAVVANDKGSLGSAVASLTIVNP